MSKFKEGTRVLTIVNSKIKRGVINSFYDALGTAVVQFDDDSVEKVKAWNLVIDHEIAKAEPEKPTEPVEKSEITITLSEFMKIATKEAVEMTREFGDMVGMTCAIFNGRLSYALFYNEVTND